MKTLLFFTILACFPQTYHGQHPKLQEAYKGIFFESVSKFPGLVYERTDYGAVKYSSPSEITVWNSIQLHEPADYIFRREDSLWRIDYNVHPSQAICALANIIDLFGKYDSWDYTERTIGYTEYYWSYFWTTPSVYLTLTIHNMENECIGNTAWITVGVPLDAELSVKQKKAKKEQEARSQQHHEELRQMFNRKK
jgi:hypothetical protein